MQEFYELAQVEQWINSQDKQAAAFRGLDLSVLENKMLGLCQYQHCLFLSCQLSLKLAGHITLNQGLVINDTEQYKFDTHRATLYSRDELYGDIDVDDPSAFKNSPDYQIYEQYLKFNEDHAFSIHVSLYRRLHDHSITDLLKEEIKGEKVVAMMGGHSIERADEDYAKVAKLSRKLSREGFLMVSGGGPGAMEATHLGAYFADYNEADLDDAINIIKQRPDPQKHEYQDRTWLNQAYRVLNKYPPKADSKYKSIGVPTWLYGHEPSAPFASHIAKYFANSVREDGLLEIAQYGVIFARGSAGTTQEIFQDACQNHYETFGGVSPMILMGVDFWTKERPVWDFLQAVSHNKKYGELVTLTDDSSEIIKQLKAYDPVKYQKSTKS